MSWVDLIDYENDYEIFNEYPYEIRKKKNGKVLKESINGDGYYVVKLNGNMNYKHRLIAKQFLPNPDSLPLIDHKNKDRTDNHIENLRWVTRSTNSKNRSGHKGVDYVIIDYEYCPDDLTVVDEYNTHKLEDYYYSPENNRFFFDSGVDLRILHINFDKKSGLAFVCMKDINNKRVKVFFTKFKRLYGF